MFLIFVTNFKFYNVQNSLQIPTIAIVYEIQSQI